jgi:hypothetical protein
MSRRERRQKRNARLREQIAKLPPSSDEDWVPIDQPARPEFEAEITTHRPTATRTTLGLIIAGIPGALIGFAARKKERQRIEIHKR